MSSTYSNLKIELITTGEQAGDWGDTTNTNLGTALEEAIVGRAEVVLSNADRTLTLTDTNATQIARHFILNVTGALTATRTITVPAIDKPFLVENNTTGSQSVIIKTSSGTGVTIPNGRKMFVFAYNDGAANDVIEAFNYVSTLYAGTLTLTTPLPVASGGTGSTSTTYCSLATNVTGTLPIANGGSGQTTANAALNAFLPNQATNNGLFLTTNGTNTSWAAAGGGGGGDVVSVDASGGTTGMSFTGGPITTSGTLTLGGTLTVANGGTGAATHTANGLLTGNGTSAVTAIAPGTNGQVLTSNGTNWYAAAVVGGGDVSGPASSTTNAIATYSGTTGKLLLNNPNVTISSGTITAVGFSGNGASLTDLTATNLTTGYVSSSVLGTGSATSSTFLRGDNTWAVPASSGVTQVNGTGTVNGITLSGTVSSTGNLTLGGTLSGVSLTTQVSGTLPITNGGTGSAAAAYCSLTSNVTGILPIANGGTGATSLAGAGIGTLSGTQTFTGTKTFSGTVTGGGFLSTPGTYNYSASTSTFGGASSITASIAGVSTLNLTGSAVTCSITNRCTLGTASILWGQIYSSIATISTSDRNYKQDIAELDAAEKRVAVAIKGLIKKFRFKDAVAEKGASARIHVGVIAQEVQVAFTAEGLDASRYGLFCSDTWWEKEVQVERDGITSTEMLTSETPTAGYTERTRLGMRYEELLAFVISAL